MNRTHPIRLTQAGANSYSRVSAVIRAVGCVYEAREYRLLNDRARAARWLECAANWRRVLLRQRIGA